MRLLEISDASSFLTRTSSFLLQAEAENNLLLSSLQTLARASASRSHKLSFYLVENDEKVVCAALNSTERRMLLSSSEPTTAAFMSDELSQRGLSLKGVWGPALAAIAFADKWQKSSGREFEKRQHQKVLRLKTLRTQPSAMGICRPARDKDIKFLIKWSLLFAEESGLDESPQETEEVVRRYVENRQLYIWEDQKPVAMAGYSGQTPNGVRVNMVYTDAKYRSRGYGRSLVQNLSHRLLGNGHKFCFLYVDTSNLAAIRVYEKLGYETVGEVADLR